MGEVTIEPTSPKLSAVAVAVKEAAVLLPVENPALKVPAKVPKAALVVLAVVASAAVMPEVRLAKAAATCVEFMAAEAVKVKPLTDTDCPAAVKALNVSATVSRVASSRSPDPMLVTHGASVGNSVSDTIVDPADVLRNLTYIGHAADGTSANYGSASGINGDGTADGSVYAVFTLAAGDYSLSVGGADYAKQLTETGATFPTYGVDVSVGGVPAPGAVALLAIAGMAGSRRRKEVGA
jgi:MYXO-CTERM domain-containing protein